MQTLAYFPLTFQMQFTNLIGAQGHLEGRRNQSQASHHTHPFSPQPSIWGVSRNFFKSSPEDMFIGFRERERST